MFDYPALYQYKCNAWGLSKFDMQKIYYWSLSQYERIMCLDNDILSRNDKFTQWDLEEVITNTV